MVNDLYYKFQIKDRSIFYTLGNIQAFHCISFLKSSIMSLTYPGRVFLGLPILWPQICYHAVACPALPLSRLAYRSRYR